jgi:dipeptidyl aminopeptidase/acylaminoacyl peptidase
VVGRACLLNSSLALLLSLPLAAQQAAERGGFVLRQGTDTLVIERFTRADGALRGTISVKNQPGIEYSATLGPGPSVASMTFLVRPANAAADAKPIQQVDIAMRGDSVTVATGGRTQRIATRAGALPLVNNSFAMAELFTEQARAKGGTVTIPGWASSGGVTVDVQLSPVGRDSIVFTVAGQVQRLRVDASGRILGGLLPGQRVDIDRVDAATAARIKLGRPDYSAPAGAPYTATEVTVKGQGGIPLVGTLTVPIGASGPVPAVVLITGSGQQDRDEYIPVAGGYRPFRQIADTLGRRGIAVLRLDDRMVGASGGTQGTSADYAKDIEGALAFLRTQPAIDGKRLALLGHSEGGMIAPMVAVADPLLKAIVLMAGPSQSGQEIIRYQQRQAIETDTSIKASARDSAIRVAQQSLDSAAKASVWLRFFLSYDPLATARKVKVPVLILQGANDHQVTPEQAPALAKAMRGGGDQDVTMKVFPELNHLFIHDPSGLPSGYARLSSNKVEPEVLGAIADWLVQKLGVKSGAS